MTDRVTHTTRPRALPLCFEYRPASFVRKTRLPSPRGRIIHFFIRAAFDNLRSLFDNPCNCSRRVGDKLGVGKKAFLFRRASFVRSRIRKLCPRETVERPPVFRFFFSARKRPYPKPYTVLACLPRHVRITGNEFVRRRKQLCGRRETTGENTYA